MEPGRADVIDHPVIIPVQDFFAANRAFAVARTDPQCAIFDESDSLSSFAIGQETGLMERSIAKPMERILWIFAKRGESIDCVTVSKNLTAKRANAHVGKEKCHVLLEIIVLGVRLIPCGRGRHIVLNFLADSKSGRAAPKG